MKVRDDAQLREHVAREESEKIADAATAMQERIRRGGKLIIFGNGGSATDANDWAHRLRDAPRRDTNRYPRFHSRWNLRIFPRSPTMSARN